jgi:hypothetical protein
MATIVAAILAPPTGGSIPGRAARAAGGLRGSAAVLLAWSFWAMAREPVTVGWPHRADDLHRRPDPGLQPLFDAGVHA